jgi:hypothetical protein
MKAKTKKAVKKQTPGDSKPKPETMHSLRCGALRALGLDPRDKASLRQVIAGGPKKASTINGRPRANVITLANGKRAA